MQSSQSFSRVVPRSILLPRPSPKVAAIHETVIGSGSSIQRLPHVRGVSVLRNSRWRPVASEWRSVSRPSVESELRSLVRRPVASALPTSPRVVLALAVQAWRRTAAAKTSERIARRLARLAVGRPRQQLQ